MQAAQKQFTISSEGKPVLTPGKNPLTLPTQALTQAISAEWEGQKKFNPAKMPLTLLAFTAIDQVANKKDQIVEVLLTYVDTDTLSYRASSSEKLLKHQQEQWDPILKWAGAEFSAIWQTTSGVMPLEQPESLHKSIATYLGSLDAMQLAAACILASSCSSLVLAIAVLKRHITPEAAFNLSRLEEEAQAEQWGRDFEADQRAQRVKEDISSAGQFLSLLDKA